MTPPNHSRRPAKMKEQVVQDDQKGFQKKDCVKSLKGARGGRTLFGTVLLGEVLAVKPGLQLRKVERKVLVAEQDGGNVIPTIKGQCPVWRGECSKVFVVTVLGAES